MHKNILLGMKSSGDQAGDGRLFYIIQCQQRTFGGLELHLNDFMKDLLWL
jgi:hypothetical protein